ncbi:hypothetical protein BgiBS90_038070 [Biomphalaria glabrata]|nr:hypothetical protein BgiBS90_038070 [Biomphalaria glabrata]
MPKYLTSFNLAWLKDERFESWLVKSMSTKAFCKICAKSFDISNMGERALTSHMKSLKHQNNVKVGSQCLSLTSVFKTTTATPVKPSVQLVNAELQSPSESSLIQAPETQKALDKESSFVTGTSQILSTSQSSIVAHVTNEHTLTAEILWALKVVSANYSFNSCQQINGMFSKMFPDSSIAKKFSCGPNKVAYLITFGLGPHFHQLLKDSLTCSEDGFVLLFDEALNKELGKKQLDVHVRYWENDKVVTRYFNSAFLGHASAQNLFEKLQQQLDVNASKVVQISMDGPNVNWALHRLLSEDLQKQVSSNYKYIDIGSCGLHTIHNAFRAGHTASSWDLGHFFDSLWWLFKDAPSRREDFMTITGTTDFPLKHCPHRWVENIAVAERAIKVWPQMKIYINHLLTNNKALETKSFQHLRSCLADQLLFAKLECFLSIARTLEPFLKKYQCDGPMLPFMSEDILNMLVSLLQRFVSEDVLGACRSVLSLSTLDLSSTKLLAPEKVDIGFKAKKSLSVISKASPKDILVERGFSVNKEVMTTNMAEKTLVAKRTISDFIDFSGGIDNIIVTKQMLMAARASREKYRHHLDQLAEEKKKDGLKRKREEDFGELDNLKQKKMRLEKDIHSLIESADKLLNPMH